MTELELRQQIVNTFLTYLGAKQGSSQHKEIIDTYNNDSPLPRGYKVTYTDPWCATTVSTMAIKCNMKDIIPKECSCGEQIALFQQLGRWEENDTYRPQIGDIIYYDWSDGPNYATTDDKNSPNHVGMVCSVSGNTFQVVEGNKGSPSAVGIRDMKINGRYIRGFGLPDYASKATPEPAPKSDIKVYKQNGILITEMPVSFFKLTMVNRPKKSLGMTNYCNANFFGVYNENKADFTLPVGHIICDYKVDPNAANSDKNCDKYCHERGTFNDDKFTFDSSKWSYDNKFYGKALTTLQIKSNKAVINDVTSLPSGLDYAVTGIPIMLKGNDVSWKNYVSKQGWDGSELYATSHVFVGIKQEQADRIYVMGYTTKTSNLIYSAEMYNLLKPLGFRDVIKLDGGGSFYMNTGGFTIATSENRRINAIIRWERAAATPQNPYTEPKVAIKKGSTNVEGVKWVQWQLNYKDYPLNIDGSFGPATDAQVRKYQKDHGLTVDGSVGPATRKSLKE